MKGLGIALFPMILTVGCGNAHSDSPAPTEGLVCIDGLAVNGGTATVWDVLARQVSTRRWLSILPGTPGPLVLIDGVEADGVQRLTSIMAREIVSVETLESDRAVPEFGSRARDGALLVRTRAATGREYRRPENRPPERCR